MTKILIVDDDPALRRLFGKQLAQEGYDILFASNGQEGLEIAEEHAPDVIILDYQMPIMSGDVMLRHLRETAWGKHLRVIMVTAASSLQSLPEIEHADLALYKPVSRRELATMVQRLLLARRSA